MTSPAFGTVFTEHMVSGRWTEQGGWTELELGAYRPLKLDPATVGLHYGQSVFEGLKATRTDGKALAVFRPQAHGVRFANSARRLRMPELPVESFVEAVVELARADAAWVPDDPSLSLYLRPLMFAAEPSLALRPARSYELVMLAFVTENFFGRTPRAVSVWIDERFSRAAPGGTGAAKCGGNYAGTFLAQEQAAAMGCDQVVWLDATHRHLVEELGGMNLFFVYGDQPRPRLVTPPLSGTILPGITRDSVLTLAHDLDLQISEEAMPVTRWREDCASGALTEVFASGTAAEICPVGRVLSSGWGSWTMSDGAAGPVTERLSAQLSAVRRGSVADSRGWLRRVA